MASLTERKNAGVKRKAEEGSDNESEDTVILEEDGVCCMCGSSEVTVRCESGKHGVANDSLCEKCCYAPTAPTAPTPQPIDLYT